MIRSVNSLDVQTSMPVAVGSSSSSPEKGSQDTSADYFYGCFFMQSGAEQTTKAQLEKKGLGLELLVPTKVRHRRQDGVLHTETVKLFPGYVFFRTREPSIIKKFILPSLAYRLLDYGDNDWMLHGDDKMIAQDLFDVSGKVELSTAYFEGDRIRIKDGFLKKYEGNIIRVNKRMQTAQIQVNLGDKTIDVWLGYELLDK